MSDLPLGYSFEEDEDLIVPYKLTNEDEFREIMTRESMFSFPSAAVGTVVAGPAGTVAGHMIGTGAGIIRHRKIHPDRRLVDPSPPSFDEEE